MTELNEEQSYATVEDLERLEARLAALEEHLVRVDREARAHAEENAGKFSILYNELKTQRGRADRLEEATAEMARTLAVMAREAERAGGLLEQVQGRLVQNDEALAEIAAAAEGQAQAETTRREQLMAHLDTLLAQQAAQAQAFAGAITRLEDGLQALALAGRDDIRQAAQALSALQVTLAALAEQVQVQGAGAAEAAQGRARAAQERAQAEAAALAQLLAAQAQGQEPLQALGASAAALEAVSRDLQAHQRARVQQTALERARELNRQALPLLGKVLFAALQTDRGEAAIALLQEAARLAPEDTVIAANLALAYLQAEQLEQAEALLHGVLERRPDAAYALNAQGLLALRRNRAEEARAALRAAASLAPGDAATHLNLGKAYYGCGEVAPAIASWRRAQALDPALVARDSDVSILLDEQARLEETA